MLRLLGLFVGLLLIIFFLKVFRKLIAVKQKPVYVIDEDHAVIHHDGCDKILCGRKLARKLDSTEKLSELVDAGYAYCPICCAEELKK